MGYDGPGELFSDSMDALDTMVAGGARGLSLVEQGQGWSTWAYGTRDALMLATKALMDAGYRQVDMRYRPADDVLEVYCSKR